MKLELDRDGPPAYAQIIERVEAAVRRGELSAGDRLPPERRLAADLGVSRMTLRQALATLEARGLVTRATGRGGRHVRLLAEARAGPRRVRRALRAAPAPERHRGRQSPVGRRGARRRGCGRGSGARRSAIRSRRSSAFAWPIASRWRSSARASRSLAFPACSSSTSRSRSTTCSPSTTASRRHTPSSAWSRCSPASSRPRLSRCSSGAPLMLVERTAYAAGGDAVEFARDLFRGDRTRVVAWASALTAT